MCSVTLRMCYHPHQFTKTLVVLTISGKCYDKVCGIDVHRDVFVVSIVSRRGDRKTREFGTTIPDIIQLQKYVAREKCECAAFESTGIYWKKLHTALISCMDVVVANPRHVKNHCDPKTDRRDAEWLATLVLNGEIRPSRVFTGDMEQLREMTRYRVQLVRNKTQFKNRVQRAFQACQIKLSGVFADFFCKTGRRIMKGLLADLSITSILDLIAERYADKKEEVKKALTGTLDPANAYIIKSNLAKIELCEEELTRLDEWIGSMLAGRSEIAILKSMPGVQDVSAAAILSEIGNINDFKNAEKFVSYYGLAPSVHQSAGKNYTGSITKQGSRYMRRILIQVAHAIGRVKKDCKLKRFLEKMTERKGIKKAVVALARKLLVIIYHLLKNHELYEEDGYKKTTKAGKAKVKKYREMGFSYEDLVGIIEGADLLLKGDKKKKPVRKRTTA